MSMAEKHIIVAENVPKVYEAGQKAEYNTFWDTYQENGNRTDYDYAFRGDWWTDETYNPKHTPKPTKVMNMYFGCGVVEKKIECDFSELTGSLQWTFRFCKAKHLGVLDLSNSTCDTYKGSFGFMANCTDIDEIILGEKCVFGNSFSNSPKLKNVKFSGVLATNGLNVSPCPQLTHDSLMSIVNCLKDYSADTSGTSWVVTLGTTNLNKLTNAEKAIATEKGWTLA